MAVASNERTTRFSVSHFTRALVHRVHFATAYFTLFEMDVFMAITQALHHSEMHRNNGSHNNYKYTGEAGNHEIVKIIVGKKSLRAFKLFAAVRVSVY